MGFNANDFHLRPEAFYIGSNSSNQAATTNRDIDGIWWILALTQDFHPDRPLPSNHLWIIKGMDEGHSLLFTAKTSLLIGLVIGFAVEYNFTTEGTNSPYFHFRCGDWHHDHSSAMEMSCTERYTLSMVPST
ncbi:MAG: Uncharacterised protein [Prochlorococcus marinus str. MIT 9215]|nr:MAG: Uncharacterised protein [Prochlorococcus marinus str. MIT 9215]